MAAFLGIDTSNYTTSTALFDPQGNQILQKKKLLPVKEGAIGQRQSDAVFGHVKALGALAEELFADLHTPVAAVGVSATPSYEPGSYMPCFLAGEMAARTAAAALGAPLYTFSHQAGHVAAAAFGAGLPELLEQEFLAFHVSGGTTQCLLVAPDPQRVITTRTVAQSLDLHAGQAVDRVGAMLGLPFPAGPELERLAEQSVVFYKPKPTLKGADCCLSGLENQCRQMLDEGELPADVARYCLSYLRETLLVMTAKVQEQFPGLPLLYAGGVMSNQFLQDGVCERFHAHVAPPQYSADNAAGVAYLAFLRHGREETPC